MKTTLKPEQERIVTPGARAVDDLENLPGLRFHPGYVHLRNVLVPGYSSFEDDEKYPYLEVARGPAFEEFKLISFRKAASLTRSEKSFLPSAPLLLEILVHLWLNSKCGTPNEEMVGCRQALFEAMEEGIHTNTRVIWSNQKIIHYPYEQIGYPDTIQYSYNEKPHIGEHEISELQGEASQVQFLMQSLGPRATDPVTDILDVDRVEICTFGYMPASNLQFTRKENTARIYFRESQRNYQHAWEVRVP